MINGKAYREYFQAQAENHPQLLHAADNKVFAMVSVEEAIGDLRSASVSASGYLMRCIEPFHRTAPGQQHPKRFFEGGFMIARSCDVRNLGTEDYYAALDGSEAICDDILEKMYADSQNGRGFFQYAAHETLSTTSRIRPYTGDGSYGGWMYLWSIEVPFCYNSPADRTDWVDGGLTEVQ